MFRRTSKPVVLKEAGVGPEGEVPAWLTAKRNSSGSVPPPLPEFHSSLLSDDVPPLIPDWGRVSEDDLFQAREEVVPPAQKEETKDSVHRDLRMVREKIAQAREYALPKKLVVESGQHGARVSDKLNDVEAVIMSRPPEFNVDEVDPNECRELVKKIESFVNVNYGVGDATIKVEDKWVSRKSRTGTIEVEKGPILRMNKIAGQLSKMENDLADADFVGRESVKKYLWGEKEPTQLDLEVAQYALGRRMLLRILEFANVYDGRPWIVDPLKDRVESGRPQDAAALKKFYELGIEPQQHRWDRLTIEETPRFRMSLMDNLEFSLREIQAEMGGKDKLVVEEGELPEEVINEKRQTRVGRALAAWNYGREMSRKPEEEEVPPSEPVRVGGRWQDSLAEFLVVDEAWEAIRHLLRIGRGRDLAPRPEPAENESWIGKKLGNLVWNWENRRYTGEGYNKITAYNGPSWRELEDEISSKAGAGGGGDIGEQLQQQRNLQNLAEVTNLAWELSNEIRAIEQNIDGAEIPNYEGGGIWTTLIKGVQRITPGLGGRFFPVETQNERRLKDLMNNKLERLWKAQLKKQPKKYREKLDKVFGLEYYKSLVENALDQAEEKRLSDAERVNNG